jgi:hypothetical protein
VRKLVLIRLHKTAGTSFMTGLASGFEAAKICPWAFQYEFLGKSPDELGQYEFFWPHMGLMQAREILPDARVVTILRNPQDRILSSYRYWRTQYRSAPDHPDLHDLCHKVRDMSLLEYLASDDPAILRAIDNAQFRFICGGAFGHDSATRAQLFGPAAPLRELVDLALRHMVEDFDFIGVAEHLELSLSKASRVCGLNIQVADYRNNVNHDAADAGLTITAEMQRHLDRLTEYDAAVYDRAVALLFAADR